MSTIRGSTVSPHVVMEVAFGEMPVFVEEGSGVLDVRLVKSEGAVGPVRVRLFSLSGTAGGKSLSLIANYWGEIFNVNCIDP